MQQTTFFPKEKPYFGGALLKGKRKTQRPLSKKNPIHLILKAKCPVLFQHKKTIEGAIKKYSEKFGIKIYAQSMQKDHIHFNVRVHSRPMYKAFIRSLTAYLAKKVGQGLWKFRPFSRIAKWGRAFKIIQAYIEQNEREAQGVQPYTPRKHREQRE